MPKSKKNKGKEGVAKGGITKKRYPKHEPTPRNFGIGNNIQPKRDVTRFIRWPKYIRLQRQKRILLKRLKVPPVIDQFHYTLDAHTAKQLFEFLKGYIPEDKKQKRERLKKIAKDEGAEPAPKAVTLKYGLNHVTSLIEQKTAKLVIIAHDVDPLELVMWIPTACRKKEIPYLIVKGKARLGKLVHKKTASVVAITNVHPKDEAQFELFRNRAVDSFLNRYEETMNSRGGGLIKGYKHKMQQEKIRKAIEKDNARTK